MLIYNENIYKVTNIHFMEPRSESTPFVHVLNALWPCTHTECLRQVFANTMLGKLAR